MHAPTRDAFSHPSANLPTEGRLDFLVGDGLFRKLWVAAPSSVRQTDGLGPFYNARACQRCHRKDGRGRPPTGEEAGTLVLQLRHPDHGGDPVYGRQLQDKAVTGLVAEGQVRVELEDVEVALAEGPVVTLRKPRYTLGDLAFGSLDEGTVVSPRVAPPMIGMGLLEAVPAADILAHADPDDEDGDGISGRPRWIETGSESVLGRFGWKAAAPSVNRQTAGALIEDMGIGNPLLPSPHGGCTEFQEACMSAPHGDEHSRDGFEIGEEAFRMLTFYARNLAVPARRDVDDADVLRGKEHFHRAGCATCHVPAFVTHRLSNRPEQSFQLIWPYTDLLLHDMGEGLADEGETGDVLRREWRTPPLWGIGLTRTVSGHQRFLHDGRADGLLEAILWHGGEARASREAVQAMTPPDRQQLLTFLESL